MFNPFIFNFLSTDLTKPTYSAQPGEAFDCPEHDIKLLFHLLNLYYIIGFLLAEQVLSKTINCSKVPLLYIWGRNAPTDIAEWCKGSTWGFDPHSTGSIPVSVAKP